MIVITHFQQIPTLSTITSPRLDSGTPLSFKKLVDGMTPSKDIDLKERRLHSNVDKDLNTQNMQN